ncbi:permease [Longibacter salinarum]|uniref:Permease n=1 Tax=Longibacter salinarum TaxID=1850348 RepID=A0A2A8CTX6_9BACT|nr:permease [Longibacter salinarum]PEN11181.1 permease [Longibacter salinarum]
MSTSFWASYGEAAKTAVGFFWKSGWAFVLGYTISAMIQSFVPKARLTQYMGDPNLKSVALSTVFGSASSSCSFAALAAARSLIAKGAHFVAAVAFMFASTNLVIELGILILIFLGAQYLAAEIIGGLILITISSTLIRWTYPDSMLEKAREKVQREAPDMEEDFDWKERIQSRKGWYRVGQSFTNEWGMVWEEILIGFTVAGFVAVLVPESFWQALFLTNMQGELPAWFIALENALVAPFVAAATFIGSMGNIPLATVLASNGVLFAGIMGFIYSDLMVPPLVATNAKYYGWPVALYVAGIMFVSIVATALILDGTFAFVGWVPEGAREIASLTQFAIDYTFWMNVAAAVLVGVNLYLQRQHESDHDGHDHGADDEGLSAKQAVVYIFITVLIGGLVAFAITGGTG